MALVELIMPKMGESIMEATILTWLKKEGDTIEQDESVLEVATDKVDTEVPSVHEGVLKEILAKEGEVVEVGKAIAVIATNKEAIVPKSVQSPDEIPSVNEETLNLMAIENHSDRPTNGIPQVRIDTSTRFYSPLVLNIAKKEGIDRNELEMVPGSSKDGRVSKKDILNYIKVKGEGQLVATATASPVPPEGPTTSPSIHAEDEIIQMDRMRKMIAERMVDSKHIAPHVTSFVEADVTNIVFWRNRNKQSFKQKEGVNLTFTPIFIEAVAKAIKDYPMVNVTVNGDTIIKKKAINIGMAVALPSGNLIVPVIKNADQLNLAGLTKKVNELARRARNNKLTPDELSGGTFTISNVGSFGNLMGTPIILQPQVGIIALGAVVKKPAVIDTPHGDAIAIRHKMFLSHSYDHRVVDGSLGGMMVRRVADYLERFEMDRKL